MTIVFNNEWKLNENARSHQKIDWGNELISFSHTYTRLVGRHSGKAGWGRFRIKGSNGEEVNLPLDCVSNMN